MKILRETHKLRFRWIHVYHEALNYFLDGSLEKSVVIQFFFIRIRTLILTH